MFWQKWFFKPQSTILWAWINNYVCEQWITVKGLKIWPNYALIQLAGLLKISGSLIWITHISMSQWGRNFGAKPGSKNWILTWIHRKMSMEHQFGIATYSIGGIFVPSASMFQIRNCHLVWSKQLTCVCPTTTIQDMVTSSISVLEAESNWVQPHASIMTHYYFPHCQRSQDPVIYPNGAQFPGLNRHP